MMVKETVTRGCSRTNVSPQIYILKLKDAQCEGIWRQGLYTSLIKRPQPCSFHHVKLQGSGLSPDTKSVGSSVLDFPAFRTMRNKFLLFTNHLEYSLVFLL